VFTRVADGEAEAEADEESEGGEDAAEEEDGKPAAKKAKASKGGAASASASAALALKGGQRNHEGPKPIRVLAFHPDVQQPWFIYNSEEKYLHLYHRNKSYEAGFKHVLTV
jgi:hypothetical protein